MGVEKRCSRRDLNQHKGQVGDGGYEGERVGVRE